MRFFSGKGLTALKKDDYGEVWYEDWIEYQANHGLYASLLSPRDYSSKGHQFDLRRLTRFVEVFAYFSPAHAYSLHVSFLGLFVILLGSNESLKREAIQCLEAGSLFALGVSEEKHGADLLGNDFLLRRGPNGTTASGKKFYIGNANSAGIISVLAKQVGAEQPAASRRSECVFFALRPDTASGFPKVRKIRTLGIRSAFVGEFEVSNHSVADGDLISEGRAAWDSVFATINLGKFILGFGAVGICEHAFAEAFDHMHNRTLYEKRVTELPHLRTSMAIAFARLSAMKLYATRALDYVQTSCAHDRRYLLFTAVQKARVSTEGVKVITLLSECVGAWGVQADTYFELAVRDSLLIPALESSTHINFELTARFIDAYFGTVDTESAPVPPRFAVDVGEHLYVTQARYRNFRTVQFSNCIDAYCALQSIPNVSIFVEQVETFKEFVSGGIRRLNPSTDDGLQLNLGRCLSVIAYGQLVAESCVSNEVSHALVSLMFHSLIEDLSGEALRLAIQFPVNGAARTLLKSLVRVPRSNAVDFERVAQLVIQRYTEAELPPVGEDE